MECKVGNGVQSGKGVHRDLLIISAFNTPSQMYYTGQMSRYSSPKPVAKSHETEIGVR